MKRVMCVYLPDWPIQRLWHEKPALRDKPLALADPRATRGPQVVSCCPRAKRGGVRPGMPVAEAVAVRRDLHVRDQDPAGDTRALGRLAGWLERYSPIVGLEEGSAPQSVLLDLTGCAACFGGEDRLLERAVAELTAEKWLACVAIADTVGAAWGLAHHGRAEKGTEKRTEPLNLRGSVLFSVPFSAPPDKTEEALRDLPTAALRLPAEALDSLARLGVDRVGALLDLPRDVLPARFGPRVLERLDQALGRLPEVITPCRSAPEVEAFYRFEFPTDRRDVLEQVLDQMVRQVEAVLRQRGWGARRVACTFFHPGAQPLRIDLDLHQASDSAEHLRTLLHTRLEQLRVAEPVRTVRLRVPVAEPITGRQDELFESDTADGAELSALIDRLSVRVGQEAVTRVTLVPDAQPEYACRFEPLVSHQPEATSPKRQRGPSLALRAGGEGELRVFVHRPLRLLPEPEAIEVVSLVPEGRPIRFWWQGTDYPVTRSWGPERIETGWWRGQDARRDYYAVTTPLGTRFWIFRRQDDGCWFLHGCFD